MSSAFFKAAGPLKTAVKTLVLTTQVAVVSDSAHFIFVLLVQELGAVNEKGFNIFAGLGAALCEVVDIVHFFKLKDALYLDFSHLLQVCLVSDNKDHNVR